MNEVNEFKHKLEQKKCQAEEAVRMYLPKEVGEAAFMKEAMAYSVLNGGKRLRPIIMLAAFEEFGGNPEDEKKTVYPFMAAMEFIHSYSLVHDDLPDMDNDMYRRGKLTTHAKYGADMGILAGDALLNLAYETMASAVVSAASEGSIKKTHSAAYAMQIISEKSGIYGMVGGQAVDVKKTGSVLDDSDLNFVYSMKTGALLEASIMAGAVLAGVGKDVALRLGTVGRKVGLAFQIKDDILDETSTDEVLGKPVHSDKENNKTTYVTIHGLKESQQAVEKMTADAGEILDSLLGKEGFLRELLISLIERDR